MSMGMGADCRRAIEHGAQASGAGLPLRSESEARMLSPRRRWPATPLRDRNSSTLQPRPGRQDMADLFARRARASEGMAVREVTKDQVVKLKERLEREGWLSGSVRREPKRPTSSDLFPDAPALPSMVQAAKLQEATLLATRQPPAPATSRSAAGPSVDLLAEIAANELPLTVPGTRLSAAALTPTRRTESGLLPDVTGRPKASLAPSLFANAGPTSAALSFGAYEVLGKHKWMPAVSDAFRTAKGRAITLNSPLRRITEAQKAKQAQAAVLASGSFLIGTSAAVFGALAAGIGLWVAARRPDASSMRQMVTERNMSRRQRLEAGAVGSATAAIGATAEHAIRDSSIVKDLAPELKRQFGAAAAPKTVAR
jgi:hypothetical protein